MKITENNKYPLGEDEYRIWNPYRSKLAATMARIKGELSFPQAGKIIPFSVPNKDGRRELWQVIEEWLKKPRGQAYGK